MGEIDEGPFTYSTPRLCGHCRKVETVMDFCSAECSSAHYKAISNLLDGTTIRAFKERIATLEAERDTRGRLLADALTEIERLNEAAILENGSGTNYVADHELYPQRIEFTNGRVVKMRGQGHLFVCMKGDHNDK